MNKQTDDYFKDEVYFWFGKPEQALMKSACLNDKTNWNTNSDIDIEGSYGTREDCIRRHIESIVKRNESE